MTWAMEQIYNLQSRVEQLEKMVGEDPIAPDVMECTVLEHLSALQEKVDKLAEKLSCIGDGNPSLEDWLERCQEMATNKEVPL